MLYIGDGFNYLYFMEQANQPESFINTLGFLEQHEKTASKLNNGVDLHLKERLAYIKENGIKHYGVVVTGPSKERLKLRNRGHITPFKIDEVELWNWQTRYKK